VAVPHGDLFGPLDEVEPQLAAAAASVNWMGRRCAVAPDWLPVVEPFLTSAQGVALSSFLAERQSKGACIYPPQPFRMLALTPLASVKVVILGQDPYHGPGQAEGLAFSVPDGIRIPPSLRNIYQELQRDLGVAVEGGGSLRHWAQQGVLLLNTCLTVEQGQPASHARRGWEVLTTALLQACDAQEGHRVFMLWGAHAQSFRPLVDESRHLVLTANHPSPLSARRGATPFIGCGHFSASSRWLETQGVEKIEWIAKSKKTMA
jgi:uracil-DNA glycosylase